MQILKATAPLMTRPSNANAYTAGDLVANSTTAGSVINRIFTFDVFRGVLNITRCTLMKTDSDITNAAFLLHLFDVAPTYSISGDNGAVSANTTATLGSYLGSLAIASMYAALSHAVGQGVPAVGTGIRWAPTHARGAETVALYGVLAATAAYTPSSAGTTLLSVEGELAQPNNG